MNIYYFAYGSNMLSSRICNRISPVQKVCIAYLKNKQLIFNKLSIDGSGKANLIDATNKEVWGVVYKIDEEDLAKLDKFESNYERKFILCMSANGELIKAETYISNKLTTDHTPYDWYKELIVLGAEENNLPIPYIEFLTKIPSRSI